jgi:protocatechuate 3,4-dioxygenase beta subunit
MAQLDRDLATMVSRRVALGGIAAGVGGAALGAAFTRADAQAAGCLASPTETRGPFPADGSDGRGRSLNVLGLAGVVRQDLRPSFAGLRGSAEGVPLDLELRLARTGGCAPLAGHAVYLWQNDAVGDYSLYSRTDVNYLRGLQPADAEGRVRFTLIVPGCYGGRYPHCHFEVYETAAGATAGDQPLLVSQLAFPEAECRSVYAGDRRYGDSLVNLARQPIARDFVFADASPEMLAQQTVQLTGDPHGGYRGMATIVL